MSGKPLLYVGAGILFLIGLCLLGYGILNVVGSTSASGGSNWLTYGLGFGFVGVLFLAGGAGLVYAAARAGKTEVVQQVTMQVDMPGDTKIEAMKCRNCGGRAQAGERQDGRRRADGGMPVLRHDVSANRSAEVVSGDWDRNRELLFVAGKA